MAGIRYKGQIFSGAAAFGTADHVAYDNTESGLTANNVQDALDEVAGASSASGVSYDNTQSGLTADNVQNALDETNLKIDVATHIPTIVVSSSVATLADIKCAKNAFMGMVAGHIKAASASSMDQWTLLVTGLPTRKAYPISSTSGNVNTFFTIADEIGNATKLYMDTNGNLYGRCYHDKTIDFTIVYMR